MERSQFVMTYWYAIKLMDSQTGVQIQIKYWNWIVHPWSLGVLGVPESWESWESWESRESRSLKPRIVPLPDPLPATQTKPRVGVRPSNAQLTCLILSPGQNMWLQMLLRIIAWGTTRLYSYKGRVKAMSQTLCHLSRPDAWPGQDFVHAFSPKQVCNVLHVCVY